MNLNPFKPLSEKIEPVNNPAFYQHDIERKPSFFEEVLREFLKVAFLSLIGYYVPRKNKKRKRNEFR